jgi:phosphoesterase RecJ-like protein
MHTYVQREDFAVVGAEPSDTEDVVNATLSVSGAKAAIIFVGQLRGGFKLSFRSRCHLDCNEVARQFGGGGHKAAAGAFQEGTLEEVQDRVLSVVRQMLTQQG